jgi:Histidine phosphatase superfamily (branch 1)
LSFVKVLTSSLQRAKQTSELAGFGTVAIIDPDLMEWNYRQYEGKRTEKIRQERPDWNLFRDGCPAGETLDAVSARSDGPERAGIRSLDFYQSPQGLEAKFHDGSVIHGASAENHLTKV